MPNMPQAPYTMDEFNTQAKSFVQKAKEAGKSNTAIANTLQYMYAMTVKNMEAAKEDGSEWDIVKDADGNLIWVNKKTQESKSFDNDGGFDFGALESEGGVPSADSSSGLSIDESGNIPIDTSGGLDELFSSTDPGSTEDQAMQQIDEIDAERRGNTDLDLSSYGKLPLFQDDQEETGLYLGGQTNINKNLLKGF